MTRAPSRWTLVAHPWLFAAWLPLFVAARNIDEGVEAASVVLWTIGYCLGALVLWLVARALVRDAARASLLTTITILASLAYPFLDDLVKRQGNWAIAARLGLLALWLVACAVIVRRARAPEPLSLALTYSGLIAVVLAVLPFAGLAGGGPAHIQTAVGALELSPPAQPPDIYYLIFDGYGRDDVLRHYYRFDNSPFLDELEGLGFVIARQSRSNYNQTVLSIPSSLNMDFLTELVPDRRSLKKKDLRWALRDLVRDAVVPHALRDLGYRVELVTGAWRATSRSSSATRLHKCRGLSDYGVSMVERTALRLWSDRLVQAGRREQILCQYEVLERIASEPGPKFVFAHVVQPHGPWLFDANGGPPKDLGSLLLGAERKDRARYVDQVTFTNKQILRVVRAILERSERPPVIVIHGDHGPSYAFRTAPKKRLKKRVSKMGNARAMHLLREPWVQRYWHERFGILNAYLLPDGGAEKIYPQVSPVNGFRIVFNHYFEADLPLLEDRSFFSSYQNPRREWDLTRLLLRPLPPAK